MICPCKSVKQPVIICHIRIFVVVVVVIVAENVNDFKNQNGSLRARLVWP